MPCEARQRAPAGDGAHREPRVVVRPKIYGGNMPAPQTRDLNAAAPRITTVTPRAAVRLESNYGAVRARRTREANVTRAHLLYPDGRRAHTSPACERLESAASQSGPRSTTAPRGRAERGIRVRRARPRSRRHTLTHLAPTERRRRAPDYIGRRCATREDLLSETRVSSASYVPKGDDEGRRRTSG